MNKFTVYISWYEPREERFSVEAENADAAADKVLEENDEIGEDYSIDKIVDLGEVAEKPYVDPNQMAFAKQDEE